MRSVVRRLAVLRPALALLAVWAAFTGGVRFFQTALDSIQVWGIPLSLCLAVQGSLVAFAVMVVWFDRLRTPAPQKVRARR